MPTPVRPVPLSQLLTSLALIIAALYWAHTVFIPVALALLLTFLVNPVVSVLQGRGLGRTPAVILVVILMFSLLGGIGWTITADLSSLAAELPRYGENIRHKIADLRGVGHSSVIKTIQAAAQKVMDDLQQTNKPAGETEKPVQVVVQGPSVLWQLPLALGPLATAGLVLILVIFMLLKQADLRDRLLALAGYGRLTLATKALDEAGQRISRYLLMQSIINGSFGCAVGLGLFLIGLPHAIVWGFLAAVLRFIPYIGASAATILPVALSLAVFQGWLQPLLIIGLIVGLELVNTMVLEPFLYSQSAGVSAVALLVAVAFWTWLWGPVGLLLSTPLTVCLGVLGKYVPQLGLIGVLMSDEPALETSTSYYQRLIARDDDEALEIVDEFLKTHALEAVYDTVLVPALVAAKQDRQRNILTEDDWHFIVQAMREIVEELGTRQLPAETPAAEATAALVNGQGAISPPTVRMVACPARDEADEVALLMVRQVLDPTRYELQVVSAAMLTAEVISLVEQQRVSLVCIAALPPGALAPTRYLCKRLRTRSPECKIVVGRWGLTGNIEENRALLLAAGADEVGTTLRETRNQVMALSQLHASLASQPSPNAPLGQQPPGGEPHARMICKGVDEG
jgi:predicted PurR-regulated permease PerM